MCGDSTRFFCECGRKFKHYRMLKHHKKVECGQKIQCKICGKNYKTKVNLEFHLRTVHNTSIKVIGTK